MFPILQIGPLAIQTPGLALIIGLWLGLNLAEKHTHKRQIKADTYYNLVFISLIAGVVGARLAYAARFPQAFSASPASILSVNPGLFDLTGGAAAALIAGLIYGQRRNIQFWPFLDALTPTLAVFALGSSLSNVASGNAFGMETNLPWGIELWGAVRHPTQLYDLLASLVILLALWPARFDFKNTRPGRYFLVFIIYSTLARLFLEGFRGDSEIILNGFRSTQIFAWLILAAALYGFIRTGSNSSRLPKPEDGKYATPR